MRADVPPDSIGYVAVHLPELSSWQGFFVLPTLRDRGEAVLAEARRMGGGQATDDGLPGLSPGDHPLSATLAKLYALAIADPPPPGCPLHAIRSAIGATTYALPNATASPSLLVTSWRDEQDPRGLQTPVDRIESTTLEEARGRISCEIEQAQTSWGVVEGFAELVGGSVRRRGSA